MNTQQEVRVSYHNTHATKSFGICQRILQFQQECDVTPAGRFGFADCRAMRQSITVEINRKLQSDHFKSSKDEIKKNLRLRWRPICSMADAWKQHQASKSERLASIPTTSARHVMLQESIWIYVWVMCLEMSACIQIVKESTAVGTDKTRQTSFRIESQQVASTTWTLQATGRQEVGTVMCRSYEQTWQNVKIMATMWENFLTYGILWRRQPDIFATSKSKRRLLQRMHGHDYNSWRRLEGSITMVLPKQTAPPSMLGPVSPCKNHIVEWFLTRYFDLFVFAFNLHVWRKT